MSATHPSLWPVLLTWLLALAVLVLVTTLIVYLIRRMLLEAELRRRYAEGELDADDYHKRLVNLRAR